MLVGRGRHVVHEALNPVIHLLEASVQLLGVSGRQPVRDLVVASVAVCQQPRTLQVSIHHVLRVDPLRALLQADLRVPQCRREVAAGSHKLFG